MAEVRFKGRIVVLATVVLLVFTAIGSRLAMLHLRPVDWVVRPIMEARSFESKPAANRGRIVDRTGRILAMDTPSYHVCIDPKWISEHGDPVAVARHLSDEFRLSEADLAGDLAQTHREYTRIKKYVSGHQIKRFKRMNMGVVYTPAELVGGVETNIYLKGVWFEEAPIRKYPNGPLMAHVVGFSNLEGIGSAGVELRMNEYLRGKEGYRKGQVDGSGREIYRTREMDIPPEDGATVELTLDSWLQYQVEKIIEKTCHDFNAKAVWAIVQHVRTGEILAMASFPTYDPNRYSKAPEEWRRNRAIGFNYEPGSTMKAAVIAAALDHDVVDEGDVFDCEKGYWVYGGKALRDSHGEEDLTVADIVKVSSNIGTAKIALEMGNQMVYDSLRKFHFGERLDVGLPGEEGGIFYSPKHWSKISITRIGMGHEIGVTALQVLSMMNAIAYNGVQMQPYLVKRVVTPDGTVLHENKPEVIGRPLDPPAARRMQQLLARVVMEEGGTGTKAQVEGYTVAGKTGTAQKIRPKEEGGGYYSKNFTSSFAGFLPVENPEIGIIVVADDPGEYTDSGRKINYYGGTVCGPAFQEIATMAVEYLRIAPGGNRVYVARPQE
ncbi:putative peptidoglycan D,D-transpeptidase PenA [Pontiella desulfatans]|uniref:Putative peptidoglycan D,D-transpeptidase PenA n=1 Tax=Pontiella desulfatans TaxID=2750659 RepID=A0A6C2TXA9_PONDE|nr:penicillin-binding protein 2 [Pontiella desulfatans]VGO11951.1 putative peptidoglycan D,D-transpeptidase PenA [Pontiella desulfatans]